MKKLWIAFALVLLASFVVLGWIGTRIYQEMPPIPDRVVTTDGTVVIDAGEIASGPERLAVAGRHGSRLRLGARQLCRSRLDRRLAASRSHFILDRWAQQRLRQGLTTSSTTNSKRNCAAAWQRVLSAPTPTTQPRKTVTIAPDSRASLRVQPGALLRCLRQRENRLRHSAGQP